MNWEVIGELIGIILGIWLMVLGIKWIWRKLFKSKPIKKIYWKNLSFFEKVIFCIGWLSVLNFIFWIAMFIYSNMTQEDKFWNAGSYRIVYVFGWIYFVTLAFLFLFEILL